MDEGIVTARLRLRPWRNSDIDALAAILGDGQFARFVGNGEPRDRQATRARLAAVGRHWATHGFGLWAVTRLACVR